LSSTHSHSVASCGAISSSGGEFDKLVAHRGEDNPPGIGARQSRIEHGGVVGAPDTQYQGGSRGSVNCGEGRRQQEQSGGEESGHGHAKL
jgi:hypothetical protein